MWDVEVSFETISNAAIRSDAQTEIPTELQTQTAFLCSDMFCFYKLQRWMRECKRSLGEGGNIMKRGEEITFQWLAAALTMSMPTSL